MGRYITMYVETSEYGRASWDGLALFETIPNGRLIYPYIEGEFEEERMNRGLPNDVSMEAKKYFTEYHQMYELSWMWPWEMTKALWTFLKKEKFKAPFEYRMICRLMWVAFFRLRKVRVIFGFC